MLCICKLCESKCSACRLLCTDASSDFVESTESPSVSVMQVLMHRYVKVCTLSLTWWFASNLVSGGCRRTRSTPRVAFALKAHYRTSAGVAGVRDELPSSTRALSSLPPKNHRSKLVGGMGDGSVRNERK